MGCEGYGTLKPLVVGIVNVDDRNKYTVETSNKDILTVTTDAFQHAWYPKFALGGGVWSKVLERNGVVTSDYYLGADDYGYGVRFGTDVHFHREDELEPKHEEPTMDMSGGPIARYAPFVVKNGQRKPSVMVMQESFNRLIADGQLTGEQLVVDGVFGPKTDGVVKAFQGQLGVVQDGQVGKNTWKAMIERLPTEWRPTLRFRLAVLQDTYENGPRNNSFAAVTKVSTEGWWNYGVWNVNYPAAWGGSISGSSLGILLALAGRKDLYASEPNDPDNIAYFMGSSEGRRVQLYDYFDKYVVGPAIEHLRNAGFSQFTFSADQLPTKLAPMDERLLAISVDIAVNSGPYGFASKRVPRIWDGEGTLAWDPHLPDRDACIAIFNEVFTASGENSAPCNITPTAQYDYSVNTRDPYMKALKRCLWEVCTDDWQRVYLIADLQGRCIKTSALEGSTLQKEVIKRRRSVVRKGGYVFQGTEYDLTEMFGIG